MLMLGFVCAARMTRRPILPNPLIPTRIDMVFLVPCASASVWRRRVGGVSACFFIASMASGCVFSASTAQFVARLRWSSVELRGAADRCTKRSGHAVPISHAASARARAKHKAQPRGNFRRARRRDRASAAGAFDSDARMPTKYRRCSKRRGAHAVWNSWSVS